MIQYLATGGHISIKAPDVFSDVSDASFTSTLLMGLDVGMFFLTFAALFEPSWGGLMDNHILTQLHLLLPELDMEGEGPPFAWGLPGHGLHFPSLRLRFAKSNSL